jgi:hypothetical protein
LYPFRRCSINIIALVEGVNDGHNRLVCRERILNVVQSLHIFIVVL